ncbi:uncharacterized protein MELLADRAFT_107936 [Melampsora larici-populina 98AG31]|uniref:Secreted protein n=1 Tax=Melampsora larici-populina (strain 98AG31 / pathotype 3-4-7) TaxID=747676 RepID=F4RRF9_MELLP|nr:uncharacterized protein MELLADRAFT_107936 [Melampsora larici-populina 98AG31]EGG04931.1 secreted protein [Melampsora larici-populina 98AG31]
MNKFSLLATFITIFLAAFSRAFSFSESLETLSGHNTALWQDGAKDAVGNFFDAVDEGNIENLQKTISNPKAAVFSFNGRELKGEAIIHAFHDAAVKSGNTFEKQITAVKCFKNEDNQIQVNVEGLVSKNGGPGEAYKATLIIKDKKVETLKSVLGSTSA